MSFSLERLGQRLLGSTLLLGGGLLAMALASYSPTDPSFNTATSARAGNALGLFGATISDLLLQMTGLASILPVLCLVAWGARMMAGQTVPRFWARILAVPPGLLLFAIGLAVLPSTWFWPLTAHPGGFAGTLLLAHVSHLLIAAGAVVPFLSWMIAGLALGLGLLVLSFVTGISLAGVGRGFRRKANKAALKPVETFPEEEEDGKPGLLARIEFLRSRLFARLPGGRSRHSPTFEEDVEETGNDDGQIPASLSRDGSEAGGDAPVSGEGQATRGGRGVAGRRAAQTRARTQEKLTPERSVDPSGYEAPPLELLTPLSPTQKIQKINEEILAENARSLETVLQDFGVNGRIVKVRPGPVVTLYELEPAPGTKTSRVIGLSDDIARSMKALAVRIAVVPGQSVIGIELPNAKRETVLLRELLTSATPEPAAGRLLLALGKDIGGAPMQVDLARMPHLLIAGTTGSGKSVAINTMILSLLYRLSPSDCRMIMIDPKMLELSSYDGIPHLLAPVVTDPGKAVVALKWTVKEMENRYRAMSQLGVRNIAGYNQRVIEARETGQKLNRTVQTGFDPETGKPIYEEQGLPLDPLPFIVVVVDEMADLMLVAGKDVEGAIQRLAQMARAAGIHLIMATQRPSVDVITGTIKANFPTRISFQVTSKIDSRTILGEQGAEQLLGQGDMLYMAAGGRITRVHGPFVSDEEVERVVRHLRTLGTPNYLDAITSEDEDEEVGSAAEERESGGTDGKLYREAVEIVLRERKASTSFIQRQLQIGYNRAAKIMERMESEGLVSSPNHVGKREILTGRDRP
ncbi:MAG: DNA translocase FtsK [Alphaproteobacteria bacterium]